MEPFNHFFANVDGVIFILIDSPNLVTLIGLLANILTFILVLYCSNMLTDDCPSWMYFLIPISVFFYSSMDAMDGKQARRTGTSSPMGQLFDHCCDSSNMILILFMMASILRMPIDGIMFNVVIHSSMLTFVTASFEEYCTGLFYLGYVSGPTEGMLAFCLISVISGIYSPSFWEQTAFGFQLNMLLMSFFILTSVFTMLSK